MLPEDYGFGFRNSQDTIWGLWSADVSTSKICSDVNMLTQLKGAEFDILINNSTLAKDVKGQYTELIYWNGNRVNP